MLKTTRRKFLKDTFVAGTAFAVYGCQTTPRIIGANNRLRIAVAGVNGRGGSHIKGWLEQDNVEVAYLIDPDERVLAQKLKYLKERPKASLPVGVLRMFGKHLTIRTLMHFPLPRRITGIR